MRCRRPWVQPQSPRSGRAFALRVSVTAIGGRVLVPSASSRLGESILLSRAALAPARPGCRWHLSTCLTGICERGRRVCEDSACALATRSARSGAAGSPAGRPRQRQTSLRRSRARLRSRLTKTSGVSLWWRFAASCGALIAADVRANDDERGLGGTAFRGDGQRRCRTNVCSGDRLGSHAGPRRTVTRRGACGHEGGAERRVDVERGRRARGGKHVGRRPGRRLA
ncbi:hypothetical protein TRVL_08610 [Trypanosoma vivax]|nr:hypothetical protein TRVL_08610 [Trypanosoma vivax]